MPEIAVVVESVIEWRKDPSRKMLGRQERKAELDWLSIEIVDRETLSSKLVHQTPLPKFVLVKLLFRNGSSTEDLV